MKYCFYSSPYAGTHEWEKFTINYKEIKLLVICKKCGAYAYRGMYGPDVHYTVGEEYKELTCDECLILRVLK